MPSYWKIYSIILDVASFVAISISSFVQYFFSLLSQYFFTNECAKGYELSLYPVFFSILVEILVLNHSLPILLLILLLCFILFTYFPVKIGLFKDPVTNSYGIVEKNT